MYLLACEKTHEAIAIDPLDHALCLKTAYDMGWKIKIVANTHHHHDHTSGVLGLLNEYPDAQIYSPSELFSLTINKITDGDKIKTSLNEFQVFSAPGHTLDHVVLCDTKNKLLFVGDVLFRLGCGRVFEGTIEQMHNSLNKLLNLSDDMTVYCGHEYTLNNLKFLEHLFVQNDILENTKKQILRDLKLKNKWIMQTSMKI